MTEEKRTRARVTVASEEAPGTDTEVEQEEAQSTTPHEAALRGSMEVLDDDLELLFVEVPRPFKIRVNNDLVIDIQQGAQKLEKFLANHWYAKANGIRIVE